MVSAKRARARAICLLGFVQVGNVRTCKSKLRYKQEEVGSFRRSLRWSFSALAAQTENCAQPVFLCLVGPEEAVSVWGDQKFTQARINREGRQRFDQAIRRGQPTTAAARQRREREKIKFFCCQLTGWRSAFSMARPKARARTHFIFHFHHFRARSVRATL